MGYTNSSGVGISQPNRFGVMTPNNRAPGGSNPVAPVNSPGTASIPWYESGPLWTAIFLFVGYIAVYRTIR